MSAPAEAWATAAAGVELERGVVVDVAVGSDDAAVPVVGVLVDAEVGDQHQLVTDRGSEVAQGNLHDAVVGAGSAALGVLDGGDAEEDDRGDAELDEGVDLGLQTDSRVCCTTPGRLAMGCGLSMPSRTKSGAMKSSTVTVVSATMRRSAGVRRSRRSRR